MATKEQQERFGNYALAFGSDSNIDRHLCRRVVPLEVLHLSYSRTGTLSMRKAYEILGYPSPYHFSDIFGNAKDCDMWQEAFQAKFNGKGTFGREQWDQLLGHCGAVTDMPVIIFAEELVDAYPDAKVVLVERDVESWYRSMNTLFTTSMDPVFVSLRFLDPLWIGRIIRVGVTSYGYMFGSGNWATLPGIRKRARQAYREHYANVRAIVPKERLLEYKLGDGWEPLCEFLGKPVPDVPFPHLNESKDLKDMFDAFAVKALKRSAINLVGALTFVAAPALIWFTMRKRGVGSLRELLKR